MKKEKGFTLIELLIASVVSLTVTAGIFFVYNASQRYLKASSAFITVSGKGRNTVEMIARLIRQANLVNVTSGGDRVEIRYDGNEPPTSTTSDDNNVAFYVNDNRLYFMDMDLTTGATLLADNVMNIGQNDIFSKDGNEITIMYKIQDTYPNDGYQAQDVVTRVIMRN